MALNVTLTFPRSQLTGLTPLRIELNEAISASFELVLDVESTDHGIDMRKVVGEGIVVGLNDEPLLSEIEGFVRRVDQITSEPTGQSQYRLFVVPPLWLTTRRRDHRIFKDLSVPEIVAAVLAGYAGRIAPPTVALGAAHPKREYTVQYGETDHDFILRLLADEGIASFFDHGRRSAWTLVDDTTVFTPSVPGQIPLLPSSLLTTRGPFVSAVSVRSEIDTSEVGLRDYDFEKPEFMLQAKATATGNLFSNEAALESYEFEVGNFMLQPEADARAQQLLEEARAHRRVLACETNFALGAGTRFSLTGHPRSDVDGDLLVVRAQTVLDARTTSTISRHTLECVDADRFFRPARRPKPRIFGTQTAFVVGAPGEEIDVDQFGRVEVEFRWDRRDLHTRGASRRVRVSQGWAGAAFGFVLLPRVNEEVIVAYLDGDPDEPIIVGRVHNAFVATPLDLPAQKTQSVWRSHSSPGGNGFNEIRMEDLAGSELLSIHAQRDFHSDTGRNADTTVGVNQTLKVGGHSTHKVAGAYSLGSASTTISTGAYTLNAATIDESGKDHVNITTNQRTDVSQFHAIDAIGVYVHGKSAISLSVGGSEIDIEDGSIKLSNGGSSIKITSGAIDIKSGGTITINGAKVDVKGTPIKLNC